MARKALISTTDWAQDSGASISVSVGAFESLLPASNMLDRRPQLVAQATGTSLAFTVALGATRTLGLIHFQNLLTDPTGTIRVQAGSYDSGTVNSWPTDTSGTYASALYSALGRPRIFIPPSPVSASSITVTISAVATPLRIGFFGACEVWEAPDDLLIGSSMTILDGADISQVPFGSTYVTEQGKRRRVDFGLPPLPDTRGSDDDYVDYYSEVFDLVLVNGKSTPVILAPFPDDIDTLERGAVWGLISTDQQFTNAFYGHHNITAFQITQLI